jgi:HK97 family phage portal protein
VGLFTRRPRADDIEDRALTAETLPPVFLGGIYPYGEPTDSPLVAPSTALRIGTVFACVRLLADTAASLPLVAFRDTPTGRVKTTGRLASLLANPAPGITQADLVGTLVGHLNVWGNAYLGKYRSSDQVPVEQIAPIHPATITVGLVNGQPIYTLVRPDGVSQHDASDILHIKALSLDGLLGLSPIQLCRNTLSLANSLGQHATTFAQNAGRVSGVLRIPGWRTAQPGATEQVRADWESRFTGAAQSGKLLLLAGEDDVTYQQLSLSMVDAQFVEQVQMSLQEICRIFRVPPHLIAVSTGERMTYSNVEMEASEFLKFSLSPWLVRIEQALSSDADLSPATQGCRFDVDTLLRADTLSRAQYLTAALNPQTGWMTRNEARAIEGYPMEAE